MKILIVDDDPIARKLVTRFLITLGIKEEDIVTAVNGHIAVDLVRASETPL